MRSFDPERERERTKFSFESSYQLGIDHFWLRDGWLSSLPLLGPLPISVLKHHLAEACAGPMHVASVSRGIAKFIITSYFIVMCELFCLVVWFYLFICLF